MLDLVLIGAGGFARELYAMLHDVFPATDYRVKGFLAQDEGGLRDHGIELPVLGDPEDYCPAQNDRLLLAIGAMPVRRRVIEALESKGGQVVSFVHPQAVVSPTAEIGLGAVIYPFAVVSNAARLEPHVHLNYYACVGHDCRVGTYSLFAPYATINGFVRLGVENYLSTHSSVAPGRTLGDRCKISANSACMQDAAANTMDFRRAGSPGPTTRSALFLKHR